MTLADIFKTSRTNVVSSILQFPAIDTDGMIKNMQLKERAKEQGGKNLPASDSEGFDAVEQNIVNEIENEGKIQFNAYLDHQKTYADRAGDASIHKLVLKVGAIVGDSRTDFERHTHAGTDALHASKREVIESDAELKRFREHHHLERPARDYGRRTYKIGFLVLIVAIESFLNGYFLSKGNVFGLIGGVFDALLISFVNVFVGAMVGLFVLPWVIYRNWGPRLIAVISTPIYLSFAVSFNLAVAHYRNAVVSDPFEASVVAGRSLLANPLGIQDLQSWGLFLIGIIFSTIAAYDGWRMDDPYPGYGQRIRQNLEAMEEYNALKDQLLADLEEIKKSAEETMDNVARSIETHQGEISYVAIKSQALKASMLQHYMHLEVAANTLLRFYHDENRKNRTTPAPVRFDTPWKYERPSMEGVIFVDTNRNAIDEAQRKLLEEAPRQRRALHNAYREALAEYERIDDLVDVRMPHESPSTTH